MLDQSNYQLKGGYYFPEYDHHFTGEHEISHLYKALEEVKSFRTAIDCGAHVGTWTKRLSERFKTVIAFEPDRRNFDCLVKNNPLVTFYNCAVGNKKTRGSLHSPLDYGNSGAAWVVEGDDFEIVRLDDLDIPDVDFIKFDIEGYEPFAIQGAKELIQKYKPVILVEQKQITARYGLHYMEAGRLLEGMGYKLKTSLDNDFIYV